LVWMLQTVTLCIKHKSPLEDHCPHCQKRQSFLKADTLPGHCTQCNAWLGGAFLGGDKRSMRRRWSGRDGSCAH
jgi:hypothetical protein